MGTIINIAYTAQADVATVAGVLSVDISQVVYTDWSGGTSPPPYQLSVPTNLAGVLNGKTTITLSWDSPTSTDAPYVSGWTINVDYNGAGYNLLVNVTNTGSGSEVYVYDVSDGAGAYSYVIKAISNDVPLDSDFSSSVTVNV